MGSRRAFFQIRGGRGESEEGLRSRAREQGAAAVARTNLSPPRVRGGRGRHRRVNAWIPCRSKVFQRRRSRTQKGKRQESLFFSIIPEHVNPSQEKDGQKGGKAQGRFCRGKESGAITTFGDNSGARGREAQKKRRRNEKNMKTIEAGAKGTSFLSRRDAINWQAPARGKCSAGTNERRGGNHRKGQ